MPTSYFVVLFLALASAFCYASTDAKLQGNKTVDVIQAEIQIRNAFPPNPRPLHFDCDTGGSIDLLPGGTHAWIVQADKIESCDASYDYDWGHGDATFTAWDANKDIGHAFAYWAVRVDGFFHRWDNVNCEKRALWQR